MQDKITGGNRFLGNGLLLQLNKWFTDLAKMVTGRQDAVSIFLEHHHLDDVVVRFKPEEFVEVDGTVDLFGEVKPFKIRWKK